MHPNVKKLLDLQKVDQEIAVLRRDADSLPAEEAKRQRRLDEVNRVATERRQLATQAEVDMRTLDTAIRQGDDEIKKLTERLSSVRNNAEYQATLFQIESVKKDRDQTQEECLKIVETLEAQKAQADEAEKRLAEEQKVFDEFVVEAEKVRKATEESVRGVEESRVGVADAVPPDLLTEYERLFKTRQNQAVCSVEGSFCQGCYNKVTTNDRARLMGASSIVRCGSCQRILYMD
ncbi:MAG: hypothetical protein VYE77_09990 [Planctomycetota bacterium]|nr:hypothetical protein [Planctomycetota bacterium]